MTDRSQGTTKAPLIFTNRPSKILMQFYKEFFSQERLFEFSANDFRYTDGMRDSGSLIINMDYDRDTETTNATPALILGVGGWQERLDSIDNRNSHQFGIGVRHKSTIISAFSMTAITDNIGSAEILQGLAAFALISMRRAIYEFGIDRISEPSGQPPRKLSGPQSDKSYAASFTFNVEHRADWVEVWDTALEKKIAATIHGRVGSAGGATVSRRSKVNH